MNLHDLHQQAGASVAPDGIPLQFGDQQAEYEAALQAAVLMDRSHEGRFETVGRDRFEVINRISTNDVIHMAAGEGRPTILTSVTGRIIDRLMVYNRGELALVTTEPGRSQAVRDSLQRQIFFNDEMRIIDLGGSTKQFALHGPSVQAILQTFSPDAGKHEYLEAVNATIGDGEVILLQRKAFVGDHWIVIVPNEQAAAVWQALLDYRRLVRSSITLYVSAQDDPPQDANSAKITFHWKPVCGMRSVSKRAAIPDKKSSHVWKAVTDWRRLW